MVINALTLSGMSIVIGVTVYIPIFAQSVLGKMQRRLVYY